MHYKGKVIDTATAPLTSTGKSVDDAIQCDYTEEDTVRSFVDIWKKESDSSSKKSSY